MTYVRKNLSLSVIRIHLKRNYFFLIIPALQINAVYCLELFSFFFQHWWLVSTT